MAQTVASGSKQASHTTLAYETLFAGLSCLTYKSLAKLMHRRATFLLAISLSFQSGFAENEEILGSARDVVVTMLPSPIPEDPEVDSDYIVSFGPSHKFIWNLFTKRPEISRFNRYTTRDWQSRLPEFRCALVAKAKEKEFEFEELEKCLGQINDSEVWTDYHDQKIAYLPISAYRGKKGDTDVWVLLCLWEYAAPITEEYMGVDPETSEELAPRKIDPPEWLPIAHIRVFTYSIKTLELIGYVTCD